MNLKEIVNRPDRLPLETSECVFVIKEYIKIRKKVDIKLSSSPSMTDLPLMGKMTTFAICWLREHPEQLN